MNNFPFPIPANETKRIKALHKYDVLTTFTEKEYDFITLMASQICNTPVALVTLLDKKKQWIKSGFGFNISETPRELSFCNYTILDADNVNIVPDMRLDERYNKNLLVTGEPHAVFYAGAPLVTPEGFVLGSLCVLDSHAKELSIQQQEALKALAKQVITTMELRKKNKDLKITQEELRATNKNLKGFIKLVSHDMKTPLANITMLSRGFVSSHKEKLSAQSEGYLKLIENSSLELISFIDKMMKKTELRTTRRKREKAVNTLKVLNKSIQFVAPPEGVEINIKGNFPKLTMDETSLQQVFQNLITNAIKYNDKPKGNITIMADSDKTHHYFYFSDNGSGISESHLEKIFKKQQTLNKTDRYGNKGTGIGLANVKCIIESAGGQISVSSKLNIGTDFKIAFPLELNTNFPGA